MNSQTALRYPKRLVALHWLTVVLLVVQFGIGFLTDELVENTTMFPVHLILGLVILGVTLVRFAFKVMLKARIPAKPASLGEKEWLVAKLGHIGLYGLLIVAPLSGLAAWNIEALEEVHETVITIFWILIALHVLAVVKHRVMEKENLMERMRF